MVAEEERGGGGRRQECHVVSQPLPSKRKCAGDFSVVWSWDLTPPCPWSGAGGPEHLHQHLGITFGFCENKCLSDLVNKHCTVVIKQ